MITEPLTLYKLMILYLLKSINYPLTNNQLSAFFLDYEYTTYFTLQQAISALEDAHLITAHTTRNATRYEITREGSETLELFGSDISSGATMSRMITGTISCIWRSGRKAPSCSLSISMFRIRISPSACVRSGLPTIRRSTRIS